MKSNTIADMSYNAQYKIQYDKDDGDDITEENIYDNFTIDDMTYSEYIETYHTYINIL